MPLVCSEHRATKHFRQAVRDIAADQGGEVSEGDYLTKATWDVNGTELTLSCAEIDGTPRLLLMLRKRCAPQEWRYYVEGAITPTQDPTKIVCHASVHASIGEMIVRVTRDIHKFLAAPASAR